MILDELASAYPRAGRGDKVKISLADRKHGPRRERRFSVRKALGRDCAVHLREVKRASPSKGRHRPGFDFEKSRRATREGRGLRFLPDRTSGSPRVGPKSSKRLKNRHQTDDPQKDFTVDEITRFIEAKVLGADAEVSICCSTPKRYAIISAFATN